MLITPENLKHEMPIALIRAANEHAQRLLAGRLPKGERLRLTRELVCLTNELDQRTRLRNNPLAQITGRY